jgi:hypothetical protein
VVALLLAMALAGPPAPDCERVRCPRERTREAGASFAFFEFAPANGAGMGSSCSCATPTGAKGEAMTFSRASSGTCLKTVGSVPQTIANGDLVTCSTGQPRVMPGPDGTSVNGLLVEAARTNSLLRSQEFDNAAWTKSGTFTPTVTADQAVAPDGTTTADRFQLVAVTAAQSTGVFQAFSIAAATATVFLKGNGGSGVVDLAQFNGVTYTCVTCSFTASGWTRCENDNISAGGASTYFLGNLGAQCAGARSAQDFFAWGAQWEAGAYPTSYIATTSAGVARAKEVATFAGSSSLSAAGSAAVTIVPEWSTGAAPVDAAALASVTNGDQYIFLEPSGANRIYIFDGTTITRTTGDFTAGTAARLWSSWTGSTQTIANSTAGTSNSGTFDGTMTTTTIGIGVNAVSLVFQPDAVLKRASLDPSPARSR